MSGEVPTAASASTKTSVGDVDAWDRLGWMWHVLFAVTLAVPTAMAASDSASATADRLLVVAVAVAFGLWHWMVLARHPERWEQPAPMIGYWLVAIALVGVLAGIHGSFIILMYGIYPLMFATMGWWALGPFVLVTALVGVRTGFLGSGGEALLALLASSVLAAGIAVFIDRIAGQSDERRQALDALAATRAELAATARHAGVLEERARLARELHDTVAQSLTSVVTHLEAAEQAADQLVARPAAVAPERLRHHLDQARATARAGLAEVRRSVHDLRPDLLDGQSLSHALQAACARWSATSGVLAHVEITGIPAALHPNTETALLRTAQESLHNVERHADATRVVLTLSYLDTRVMLDVHDDGQGFHESDMTIGEDHGFGLTAMRERLAAVGGHLVVESTPGLGTTIAAEVPA